MVKSYKKCYYTPVQGLIGSSRNEVVMSDGMKRLLIWAIIAFAGFYLFTQPANAAAAVGGTFVFLGHAANSVITFLTALFT